MNPLALVRDVWSAVMLMTVGVGLFSCLLLLIRPRMPRTPSLCLAGLIAIICWMNLDFVAMIAGCYATYPIIFHSSPLFLLMGPLHYGFAHTLAGGRIRPGVALLHALPAVLFAINLAPHYAELLREGFEWQGGETLRDHYLFPLGGYTVMGGHLVQTAIYVFASFRILVSFRSRLLQTTAHGGVDTIALLRNLTLGLLLFLLAVLAGMLHMMVGGTHITAFEFVMAATLNLLAILAAWAVWSEPLPEGVAHDPAPAGDTPAVVLHRDPAPVVSPREPASGTARTTYARSGLGAEEITALAGRIRDVLETERLYLNPGLRLRDLAEAVGSTPYHVSQVLNQEHGHNFFDFVNEYRVEEVKRRLLRGTGELTILGVALECGFTSKSSFNRIFKKHTGSTPTAWLAGRETAR